MNTHTTPRPGRPSKAAASDNPSKRVEAVAIATSTIGLKNPPCCGRANAPKLLRSKIIGNIRKANATCTLCGHQLLITYERRKEEWWPVMARDITRQPITELPEKTDE